MAGGTAEAAETGDGEQQIVKPKIVDEGESDQAEAGGSAGRGAKDSGADLVDEDANDRCGYAGHAKAEGQAQGERAAAPAQVIAHRRHKEGKRHSVGGRSSDVHQQRYGYNDPAVIQTSRPG